MLLGLSLLATALSAQEGELRFDHLSIEDGLSGTAVRAFHQDARGFLWVGTIEGLNRYDGYGFKVFRSDPDDPGSLAESEVTEICEDGRGELWVGTYGGGLNRFDRAAESFVHYRHDPADARSLSHDIVTSLLADHTGTLWVGTVDGLNRFDREGESFARYLPDPAGAAGLSSRSISALYEDSAGKLWIGTDAGLNRFDRAAETFVRYRHDPADPASLSHDQVQAIGEDPEGQMWIATAEGLNRFDPRTQTFAHFRHDPADPRSLSEDDLRSLLVDRAGQVWVGTASQGLNRLDRSTGTFTRYQHDPFDPQSLSDNSILCMFEDRTGILWLGTYLGVNEYNPARQQFVTYRQRPGREHTLSSNSIWAIYEDSAGILWVGTYASGLNRIDRQRQTIVQYLPDPSTPGSLPNGEISALIEDRWGVLWVGTFGGLARLDRESDRFFRYRNDPSDPESLSSESVNALYEDAAGELWVGTQRGLNRFDRRGQRFIRYPVAAGHPASLARAAVSAICEDRSGMLWISSYTDGVYRYDRDSEEFALYGHDPADRNSLSSNNVATLYCDRSDRLWIGTYGAGLNRPDPARAAFTHYRQKDGLPNDTVLGILEDDQGHLWLSTSRGLSKFDPGAETFKNYNVDDGLQGDMFSSGSSFRSRSGEMFFGGTGGFNAFFPDRIVDDPYVPPIVITQFQLFNEPAPLGRIDPDSPLRQSILETHELELSHRDYVFSFEFAALHFASPRSNRYAHRLEDFDRDWIFTDSSKRFAQYTNLSPGEYVFRVKGSNHDDVWNEEGTAIRIVVRPPPWKAWWAYSLYGLLLSAAVAGYVRSQKKKVERARASTEYERATNVRLQEADRIKDDLIAELEAKNSELERYTYTVSHDLQSPLVTIGGFVGLAKRDAAKGNKELLDQDLDRIAGAVRNMHRLLGELLEFSRIGRVVEAAQPVAFGELAREAARLVDGRTARRGVKIEIAPDLPVVVGDRTRLLQVLQNLVENALKYSEEHKTPRIEIGVRRGAENRRAGHEVFYVRDNGMGIEAKYHEKVFGLFEQLNPAAEGTGIGLALVKRIVELHGGRVWIESDGPGSGTTFCFTLATQEAESAAGVAVGYSR